MSQIKSSISNFKVTGTLVYDQISPLAMNQALSLPINFTDMQWLKTVSGSYTPNNDLWPILSIQAGQTPPNFVLFICDGLCNLLFSPGNSIYGAPVSRVLMLAGLNLSQAQMNIIYCDGRTSAPQGSMAQGTPINYELIYGLGTIS